MNMFIQVKSLFWKVIDHKENILGGYPRNLVGLGKYI